MHDFTTRLKKSFHKHPILYNILLAILSLIVFGWLVLLFIDLWTHHGATSVVPDIKFMQFEKAVEELDENNLEIEVSDSIFMSDIADSTYKHKLTPGMVIESWPKAGAVVKRARPVYVTIVAYSPKEVTLSTPIDNISSRQAMSILQGLGINNVRIIYVPSLYNDNVERALYDGRQLNVGSVIPVTATVTLEVGQSIPETYDEPTDSTAIDSIQDELNATGGEDIIDIDAYGDDSDLYD